MLGSRLIAGLFALTLGLIIASPWALAPLLATATQAAAQTTASCIAQHSTLRRLAGSARFTIEAPDRLKVGETITVRWQVDAEFPTRVPAYLALALPDAMRIQADLGPQQQADQYGNVPLRKPITGYIALPSTTRNPHGMSFGRPGDPLHDEASGFARRWGHARILVPLHQPGSRQRGSFQIKPLRAGRWTLTANVITGLACGSERLSQERSRTITVEASAPEIIVQDPYSLDAPDQVIVANSGRHRAHVFKGRYRVFDTATGAKIVDRAGHDPNFSPTSRYVVADIADNDGMHFEVVDLLDGRVISLPVGPMIAFAEGDAVLVDALPRLGGLSAEQLLIDVPEQRAAKLMEIGQGPGSCNACAGWDSSGVRVDLDNGVVVFAGGFGEEATLNAWSGARSIAAKDADDLRATMARDYQVAPFAVPDKRLSWSALQYAHAAHYSAEDAEIFADQSWYKAAMALADRRVVHNGVDPRDRVSVPALLNQDAEATQVALATGDWRGQARAAAGAQDTGQRRLIESLALFGLAVLPPTQKERAWPTAAIEAARTGDNRFLTYEAQQDLQAPAIKALEQRFLAAFPALKRLFSTYDKPEYVTFPYDGNFDDTARMEFDRHLMGAWRWDTFNGPLWLLQLHVIEGSGAFGSGALLLVDKKGAPGGRIVNLSGALGGFWDGSYGTNFGSTRLVTDLVFDRYLLLASRPSQTIAVFDIQTGQRTMLRTNVPQIDLLESLHLTADFANVLQVNNDGQFFLHRISDATTILSGRFVDDELILYDNQGYYSATFEGAHFVQLRFPGRAGLYTFQQFASVLEQPERIAAIIAGAPVDPRSPGLTPPPELDVTLAVDAAGSHVLKAIARASNRLAGVRVFADGQLIARVALDGQQAERTIRLPDLGGRHTLTALATDRRGFVSLPSTLRLDPGGTQKGLVFGLFAGVDTYRDPQLSDLGFAVADAERAEAAFSSALGGRASTTLLRNAAASPDALRTAIADIATKAQDGDTTVFFFAGHGLQGSDGRFYLTNTAFDASQPSATGLSWQDLARALSAVRGRIVIFIDACHSGSANADIATNDGAVSDLINGTSRPLLVFAAAKGRQFSYEHPDIGGGYFTHALAQALTTQRKDHDTNGNGVLEVSELYLALKGRVSAATARAQTPWLARRDLIGDFALF